MSLTVFQQVAENIRATIDAIEAGATYTHDISAIRPERMNISGDQTKDGTAMVSLGSITQDLSVATNESQTWEVQVFVEIAAVVSDSNTDPIEDRLAEMVADVWKALAVTISGGAACGGLAEFIDLTGVELLIDDLGPYARCTFVSRVWTAFGDLYTSAL